MIVRDPIKNFEFLWKTFQDRYPFFELRKVDWQQQFEIYRARVTNTTSDDELFEIFCDMLGPLNDGHVELIAKPSGKGKSDTFGRRKNLDSIKNSENERSNSSSKRQGRLLRTMGLHYQKRLRLGCFTTQGPRTLATFGSSSWKASRREN
jgi:hypothetical protein